MADGQEAQAPAQSPADHLTPEQILRALHLWDENKTAEQNAAAARAEGLGGWLDKPREFLDRLKPDFSFDKDKSLLENLVKFQQEGADSISAAAAIALPAAVLYLGLKHGKPYMNMPTLNVVNENPMVLLSGLEWVQKMRLSAALAEIAQTPEGAALVAGLHASGKPLSMRMDMPPGAGYVSWDTYASASRLNTVAGRVGASGVTTHGSLINVLTHELRHLQQGMERSLSPHLDGIVSPRSAVAYNRFIEADAQATATDLAWRQKLQGKPDSWQSLKDTPGWAQEVALAYERAAEIDPRAAFDGNAKRAAFDAWFTAKTTNGERIADIYNAQGLGNWPDQQQLERAVTGGATVIGDMTPEEFARAGGNGGDNYLTRTAGRALDDRFYQDSWMTEWQLTQLRGLERGYSSLQQQFNATAKPPPQQMEFDFGPEFAPQPRPVVSAPGIEAVSKPTTPPLDVALDERRPQQLPLFEEGVPAMSRMAAINNTLDGAMGVVGVVQGTMGAVRSYKEGDTAGVVVNGANAVTGGTSVAVSVARGLGHEVAPALGSVISKANIAVTVGTGIYQVATEKGNFIDTEADGSHNLGNKGERAVAVVATTATGIGLVAAGVGSAGVVPAVVAVAVVGDKAIEARRAWKDVDRQIAENGAPQRRDVTYPGEDGSPDLRKFKHVFVEMLEVSKDMRDSELPFKPERDPRTGRIKFDEMRKLVAGEDPKFLAEFERALDLNIQRQQKIMTDNDSMLPKWLRFDDSVSKQTDAQMILSDLQGAKTEFGWFKAEQQAWNAAHSVTGSAFASNKPLPTSQQATVTAQLRVNPRPGPG